MEKRTIIVNGETYVHESDIDVQKTIVEPKDGEQYCMVRTYSAGVFCGWIDPSKTEKQRNVVKKAKRIHYWSEAASLSELAMKGTSDPENCRVPAPVDLVYLERIIEVIPMTEEAIKSINKIPVWTKF